MSGVVVGTLTIDLNANTASFERSMTGMQSLSARTAAQIETSLKKISTAGLAMASAIAAGSAALIKSVMTTADELGKSAEAAGTTAEKFSVLSYAASLTHTNTETLTKGLERLSQSAFKAQNGNAQLAAVFSRMKLSIADSSGHLRDSGDLMNEVAMRFASMEDGAGKTALAMQLFGRGGAQLIPMLDELGAKQKQISDDAHAFGLVLDESTVQLSRQARESTERLSAAFKGMGFTVLSAVLPSLQALLDKLIAIGKSPAFQNLVKTLGADIARGVQALGTALEFAVNHATALRRAFEGLAALKIAAIAAPVVRDLGAGGWDKAASGVGRFAASLLGIQRAVPVFAKLADSVKTTTWMIGSLAKEEGLASAGMYALDAAMLTNPIGITVAALAAAVGGLYALRNATVEVEGSTYKLRDAYSALWINAKSNFVETGNQIKSAWKTITDAFKSGWDSVMSYLRGWGFGQWIADEIEKGLRAVRGLGEKMLDNAKSNLGVPSDIASSMEEARLQRLGIAHLGALALPKAMQTSIASPAISATRALPKTQADTGGLGVAKKDIFGDEITKLNQAIQAQSAYLDVLGESPEVTERVNAQEKARALITELNTRLLDEHRPKLTAQQAAMIEARVAAEAMLAAMNKFGEELVGQTRQSDLATAQQRALSAATLQGEEAARQAGIENQILAATYNKTADEIRAMQPELSKLRAALAAKSDADLIESADREIASLRQQTAEQRILTAALSGTIDEQRQAAIAARTYALDLQIAAMSDGAARNALIARRQALTDLAEAQNANADAQKAQRLESPLEQYRDEIDALDHEVAALAQANGGVINYSQQLQIAAQAQDDFNKLTDATIAELTRFGGLQSGVDAFFLDMQKQAISTASIVYSALKKSFDDLADQLTKLITGQKTSFGEMFKSIGREMLNSTIKSEMQKGLGALGKRFGIDTGALAGKLDGSSAAKALWVRMTKDGVGGGGGSVFGHAGGTAGSGEDDGTDDGTLDDDLGLGSGGLSGILGGIGGFFKGGMGGILSKLGGLFSSFMGGGGGGGLGSLFGSLSGALAGGGQVSPDGAYLVGEHGPEILTGMSGYVASNSASRRMLNSNAAPIYGTLNIDARGTDPVLTEQRTRAAIEAAHASAIAHGPRVQAEIAKRSTSASAGKR